MRKLKHVLALAAGAFALVAGADVFQEEPLFLDVVPYAPGKEARTADCIRQTHADTGLSVFLYCVSLDPRGKCAADNVDAAMASYRKVREELKDAKDVQFGFLLQSILGHWPRVDKETEPWQRAIDLDDVPRRFCVLDDGFRSYIRETAAKMAREKPCFILGDDDIRATSQGRECFCPRHAAEFNRRAGLSLSPEEWRRQVRENRLPENAKTITEELRREIPVTVMRLIREGIDSVDPEIPSGTCMPGVETETVYERCPVMAGKHPLVLRLANGRYEEFTRGSFVNATLTTQRFLDQYAGKIDYLLDEADTFPHTLYDRSGATFDAKMTVSLFHGLRGAKLWFIGMYKDDERIDPVYEKVLHDRRSFYRTLARTMKDSKPLGLRIANRGCEWPELTLSYFGVPFFMSLKENADAIAFFGGPNEMLGLVGDRLERTLSGKVFLDGFAVKDLCSRGDNGLIGVTAATNDIAYNLEVRTDDGSRIPIMKHKNFAPFVRTAEGAKVLSRYRFSANGFDRGEDVCAASVLYTNRLGGVTVSAGFAVPNDYMMANLRRKRWFEDCIFALDPEFPIVSRDAFPNLTLARQAGEWRVAFTVNLGMDDGGPTLGYRFGETPKTVEVLADDGAWNPIGFEVGENGDVRIPALLRPFGTIVFRWK